MNTTDITRTMFWQGPVISYKVPKGAKQGKVPGKDITFWQFAISAKGGVVNVFVHTTEDIRGKRLSFRLEVWNKQAEGNRWFNYVDLHPTKEKPTHRLAIADARVMAAPEGAKVFVAGCYNHSAQIVVMGKDEKLAELNPKDTSVASKGQKRTTKATPDAVFVHS